MKSVLQTISIMRPYNLMTLKLKPDFLELLS